MHGQEMCGAANAVKEAGEGIIWLDCSFKVTEGPPSVLVAMAGYLYFLQPYSSGKPFPHTGSLLTGLLRTLRVCPINVREKGSEEFCSGFRSWVESELRPEKHQHPPLDGVSLRRGMQCFLVPPPPNPAMGSQLKLAFFMSFLHFIDSPPTTPYICFLGRLTRTFLVLYVLLEKTHSQQTNRAQSSRMNGMLQVVTMPACGHNEHYKASKGNHVGTEQLRVT